MLSRQKSTKSAYALYIAGITRMLLSKGYSHIFSVACRALPWFLYINKHIKLCNLISSNPHLMELARRRPQLYYKYLGSYLARNFSIKERLTILTNHYSFLNRKTRSDFFSKVLHQQTIWRQLNPENEFAIKLEFPVGIDFEGDLAFVFFANDLPVYAISFTVVPASVAGGAGTQAIFVSRVQGISSFDVIRQTTKTLHDITPATLLIVALQGFGLALGINKLVGISNATHLYRHNRVNAMPFFDYDSFWQSFCGKEITNFFHIPIPFVEKPLAAIKANHRTRTIRKRAYKNQVCQEVTKYVEENLLSNQAAFAPVPADYSMASTC